MKTTHFKEEDSIQFENILKQRRLNLNHLLKDWAENNCINRKPNARKQNENK